MVNSCSEALTFVSVVTCIGLSSALKKGRGLRKSNVSSSSSAAITGLVMGALLLSGIILCGWCLCKRKRGRTSRETESKDQESRHKTNGSSICTGQCRRSQVVQLYRSQQVQQPCRCGKPDISATLPPDYFPDEKEWSSTKVYIEEESLKPYLDAFHRDTIHLEHIGEEENSI